MTDIDEATLLTNELWVYWMALGCCRSLGADDHLALQLRTAIDSGDPELLRGARAAWLALPAAERRDLLSLNAE